MIGSANFHFLGVHDPSLATLRGFAERYFQDDPPTALIKLRQLAEALAKLVAAHHALYLGERETFEQTLRRLSYDRILPRPIIEVFHRVRTLGNIAAHEGKGTHGDALSALKLAREGAVWFHRTYGKEPNFRPGPFKPPAEPEDATLPLKAEMAARLASLQAEAERTPKAKVVALVTRSEEAAEKIDLDEAETRALIDQQLQDSGWEADTKRLRWGSGLRPTKGRNIAIAEWSTDSGPADYALFAGTKLVGVVEAKRKRKNVSAAIDQAERYSIGLSEVGGGELPGGPWGDHVVPFVFARH